MAHDVFISYSTKDKIIADAVCAKLEENKIRCWIAPRDIPSGSNFAKSIIGAINTCKVFVLIWSAHTNASEHILNEINQAFDKGITIIPFRIQDIQPTDEMRYYFGRTHWLDALNPPLEKHIKTLGNTIQAILGRPPLPEPVPDEAPDTSVTHREEKTLVIKPMQAQEKNEQPAKQAEKAPAAKQAKEAGAHAASRSPRTSFSKYIPFAAGGLLVLVLVGVLASGILKRPPASDAEQITPQATKSTQPADTPVPEITPLPDWAEEFSSIILAAIKERPPDFADDFSQQIADWSFDRWHPNAEGDGGAFGCVHTNTDDLLNEISDGVLRVSVKDDCSQVFINHPKLNLRNFVLMMDVWLIDEDIILSIVKSINLNGDEWVIEYKYNKHNWQIGIINIIKASGEILFETSQPVQLKLISKDQTSFFYINNYPVAYFDTEGEPEGIPNLGFAFESSRLYPQEYQLDNLQIWDLDRIENLPIVTDMDGKKMVLTSITNPDNQNRYLYIETPLNWHQARDYCQSLGGYLVTIESDEENTFVYELSGGISWLGASDEEQEGVWVWVDGSPFEFKNWSGAQPDNSDGSEHYLVFDFDAHLSTWNDLPNEKLAFVCEWEPVQAP